MAPILVLVLEAVAYTLLACALWWKVIGGETHGIPAHPAPAIHDTSADRESDVDGRAP